MIIFMHLLHFLSIKIVMEIYGIILTLFELVVDTCTFYFKQLVWLVLYNIVDDV